MRARKYLNWYHNIDIGKDDMDIGKDFMWESRWVGGATWDFFNENLVIRNYVVWGRPSALNCIIRSYHSGYTGSHPNSEVKHGWVYLVPHQFYYPSEVAKDKSSKCIPVTMYIWECHFKRHSLPLHRNAFRNATQRMYFGMYFVTITWI